MPEKRSVKFGLRKVAIAVACVLASSMANAQTLDSLPPEVEVDVLLKRITNLILAKDYQSALPSFRKLISFNKPLPESFDFFYIETLAKTGTEAADKEADDRIRQYFSKWGRQGAHYAKVVEYSAEVMPRAEAARAKDAAEAAKFAGDRAAARGDYEKALARYQRDVENCPSLFRERVQEARSAYRQADQACLSSYGGFEAYGGNLCDAHEAYNDQYVRLGSTAERIRARERLEEISATSSDKWCDGRYTEPTLPSSLK